MLKHYATEYKELETELPGIVGQVAKCLVQMTEQGVNWNISDDTTKLTPQQDLVLTSSLLYKSFLGHRAKDQVELLRKSHQESDASRLEKVDDQRALHEVCLVVVNKK